MKHRFNKLMTASALLGLLCYLPSASAGNPYVAMGDSFTAGPGIPVPTGAPYGCTRSSQNYPQLVAAGIDMALTDVSCSAATTEHMTQSQYAGDGTNPPQLDALDANTQLVTISIGGNDIPIAEVIGVCTGLAFSNPFGSPCKDFYTIGGVDQGAQKVDAVLPKVDAVLQAVMQRAPNARVLFVGYPSVLPKNPTLSCFSYGTPFAAGDLPYADEITRRFNNVLKTAAEANGAEFVDIYTSSLGHDVCKSPNKRWVEGIFPGSIAAPFHPNLKGMQNAAAQVRNQLGY